MIGPTYLPGLPQLRFLRNQNAMSRDRVSKSPGTGFLWVASWRVRLTGNRGPRAGLNLQQAHPVQAGRMAGSPSYWRMGRAASPPLWPGPLPQPQVLARPGQRPWGAHGGRHRLRGWPHQCKHRSHLVTAGTAGVQTRTGTHHPRGFERLLDLREPLLSYLKSGDNKASGG